nr:hypothetical protein [Mucilaginibacter sp. L294]
MTFKPNRCQLDGLELLLRVLLNENKPDNIAERLVYSHVAKAYNKIRAKTEAVFIGKSTWQFSLTDQEAWALHVFFYNVTVDFVAYHYEVLTLQSIINQIDQMYHGQINPTNYTNRGLAAGTSARRLGGKA